jgi:hypothetical protein
MGALRDFKMDGRVRALRELAHSPSGRSRSVTVGPGDNSQHAPIDEPASPLSQASDETGELGGRNAELAASGIRT